MKEFVNIEFKITVRIHPGGLGYIRKYMDTIIRKISNSVAIDLHNEGFSAIVSGIDVTYPDGETDEYKAQFGEEAQK